MAEERISETEDRDFSNWDVKGKHNGYRIKYQKLWDNTKSII